MGIKDVKSPAFEDIRSGDEAEIRVKISAGLIDHFAKMTGDINPLHISGEFAKKKGFPDRIAHGLLVSSFFSTIVGTILPGRDCILQSAKFDYKNPVVAGTELTLKAKVSQKVDSVRTLVMDVTATDEKGKIVVSGKIQAGVLK